jgi:hypothetical protein
MPDIKHTRQLEMQAELTRIKAQVQNLEAELLGTGPVAYDPDWKTPNGKNLSTKGKWAISVAFKHGMTSEEAARLFQVSEKTATAWRDLVKPQ